MTIGNRLKKLRLEKRLTQQEVATRIGLAKSSYASYEGGHRNPPINKLIQLAQLYHVSTDYLLRLTDIPDSVDSLQKQHLHWDGISLSEKEFEIVHQVVELMTERYQENQEKKLRLKSSG